MKTPKETAELLIKKHRTQTIGLLLTFVLGLLVHLYVLTNKFFNYFEMNNILASMSMEQGDTLALGRWFLPAASNLFTSYSMPAVNGVLVIAYLSLTTFLVCELLNIRTLGNRILVGMAFITYPGVASTFSYGVNADAIVLSLLLAVLGVYSTYRWKYGIVAGALLIACGIGIYQPAFAMSIGVVYCLLFVRAKDKNFERKVFLTTIFKYLILLAAGFVLYYLILQGILAVTGMNLSDYRGVDSMTSFTLKGIAKGFVYSYGYFFAYFFTTAYVQNIAVVGVNVVLACLMLWKCIGVLKQNKGKNNREQNIWFLVLLAVLPIGANAAPFLMADRVGAGVDIYMMYSLMFVFVLLMKMTEDTEISMKPIIQWTVLVGMILVAVNGYTVSNQAYHRMEAMTVTTSSLLNRIVARMESKPEWNPDIPVYFVNPEQLVNDNYKVEIPWYNEMENLAGTEIKPWYNERSIAKYINVYLHFPINLATDAQKERVQKVLDLKELSFFPKEESVQVVDGVMVVKISGLE